MAFKPPGWMERREYVNFGRDIVTLNGNFTIADLEDLAARLKELKRIDDANAEIHQPNLT
jgi:hypothetical protein